MKRAAIIAAILLPCLSIPAAGQNLRTAVAGVVRIDPAAPEGAGIALRYNEAVGIMLPDNPLFIEGIEIELRIPRQFQGAESSVAWTLYGAVRPDPGAGFDYVAETVVSQLLPSRVSMVLRIPLVQNHGMRSSPFYTLIPSVQGPGKYPLLFKLSPAGKGLSAAMESAEFRAIVRPVLGNEGGIRVVLPPEQAGLKYQIFVDDQPANVHDGLVIASRGLRTIRVTAPGYKDEVVSVAVEPGVIRVADIDLQPDVPRLSIFAPQGAVVSLNGQVIPPAEWASVALEPGDHTVNCRIGDYTISRRFSAARGKRYTLELNIELTIRSEP